MEHTKGPWSVQFESEYSGGDIFGRRKTESGEVKDYICTTFGNARANAHYIVACVNQCDKLGFSAEDIEEGAIEGLVDVVRPLLEAYYNMGQMIDSQSQFTGDQLTQKAEAALEKVRGK